MSGGRWIEGDTQGKAGDVDIATHKHSRATKTADPIEAKHANHLKNKAVILRKCGGQV